MIAVDTTGAIIGEPPPSLEAPPVDMVSDSRPKIINEDEPSFLEKFIFPDPNRPKKEIRRKTLQFVKNMGKGFLKAISGPGRYLNHKIFPSYNSDNVKIPEYDRPIPENLKDTWITYADIPEEKDITLFENHPKLKNWTWKALSWFPHRYNVALNSRDYHDYQIRSAKNNPLGKILDVPSYYGNAAVARLLYLGNKAQDLATDPVGTVWTDPVLKKEIENKVKESAVAMIEGYATKHKWLEPSGKADMAYVRKNGYLLRPWYFKNDIKQFRHNIIEDGVRLIMDSGNVADAIHNHHEVNALRAIKEVKKKAKEKGWKKGRIQNRTKPIKNYIKANDILFTLNKSYEEEYKRTHQMAKDEREKIMNDNFRDKLEKDDMEKPQGQTALLTAGAGGFMGGGGGGGSVWGNWKRGRRQTWFNKYGFRTNRRGKVYHRYKRYHHYSWRWHY